MKFLKNVYVIIRYFGFNFLKDIYENYKEDKDSCNNFAEYLQDELYAMADS